MPNARGPGTAAKPLVTAAKPNPRPSPVRLPTLSIPYGVPLSVHSFHPLLFPHCIPSLLATVYHYPLHTLTPCKYPQIAIGATSTTRQRCAYIITCHCLLSTLCQLLPLASINQLLTLTHCTQSRIAHRYPLQVDTPCKSVTPCRLHPCRYGYPLQVGYPLSLAHTLRIRLSFNLAAIQSVARHLAYCRKV